MYLCYLKITKFVIILYESQSWLPRNLISYKVFAQITPSQGELFWIALVKCLLALPQKLSASPLLAFST